MALANASFFGDTLARSSMTHLDVRLQRHDHASGGTTPPHAHVGPYLALIARGTFREFIGRSEHLCTPGSLALDVGGTEHHDRFEAGRTEVINIQLPQCWLDPLLAERRFDPAFAWIHRRDLPGRARFLRAHLERPEALSPFIVEGVAAELLLLALGPGARRRKTGTAPAWVRTVEDAVRAQFRRPPALAELARQVERSPSQVARAFRSWRGLSLGAFARRLRAEHAQRLLLESDAPLHQVAREAGYSDQSHMTRELLAHLGSTPARLRREQGRNRGPAA